LIDDHICSHHIIQYVWFYPLLYHVLSRFIPYSIHLYPGNIWKYPYGPISPFLHPSSPGFRDDSARHRNLHAVAPHDLRQLRTGDLPPLHDRHKGLTGQKEDLRPMAGAMVGWIEGSIDGWMDVG